MTITGPKSLNTSVTGAMKTLLLGHLTPIQGSRHWKPWSRADRQGRGLHLQLARSEMLSKDLLETQDYTRSIFLHLDSRPGGEKASFREPPSA